MPRHNKGEGIYMNRRFGICTMIILFAVISGCKKPVNDQDAIRASIDKHLSGVSGLNLSAMNREVKQVSINGDNANAVVEFRLTDGSTGMQVGYTLERKGADWNVVQSKPLGMPDMPGMGMPGGAPDGGANSMPPGHPAVN
jgi:hypothetical protein